MTSSSAFSDGEFESYLAKYCESCGHLLSASEEIVEAVREPVHRVDILESIGDLDDVAETAAVEEGECEHCGGILVKRWYAYPAQNLPNTEYDVDEDQIKGRDPKEDALIETQPGKYDEVRELSWLDVEEET